MFCFYVCGCLISYKSHLQKSVSLSTAEAEYMALALACTEAIWLSRMVMELGFELDGKVIIRCDSKSAIQIAQNPVHCKYSKHISVRYHFVRELLQQGADGAEFDIEFVRGETNVADVFTKPLGKAKYRQFKDMLNGNMPLIDVDLESTQSIKDIWDSYE